MYRCSRVERKDKARVAERRRKEGETMKIVDIIQISKHNKKPQSLALLGLEAIKQ